MRNVSKLVVLCIVMSLILGAALVSCARPAPTGELRMAAGTFMEVFDPLIAAGYVKIHLSSMYDYLVGSPLTESKPDPDMGIAYKWDISTDYTSFTFYIREGVKFHNGDELTAEDVKFSIERLTSEEAVSAEAAALRGVIESVEVVDAYTVRITTNTPCFWLLHYLSPIVGLEGMVLPKKYIEEVGDEEFAKHPVGSGPYKFVELVSASYILYEAVEEHWRVGVPKYKTIRFLTVPERSVREAMLKKGEVEIIGIDLEAIEPMKEAGFLVHEKPGAVTGAIWFGASYRPDSPFADEKVRQAMNLAINWDEIQEYIFYGTGERTSIFPSFTYSIGAISLPLYPYDPDKAKSLLEEAGYPEGFEVYLHDIAGYPPEYRDVNETVASYWGEIGIKVNVIPVEYLTYRSKLKAHELGPTEMLGMIIIPPRVLAHGTIHALYHSQGSLSQYSIPEYDALVEELLAAETEEEYNAAMAKVLTYMYEHYMTINFGEGSIYLATITEISDWKFNYNLGEYGLEYLTTRR